MRQAVLTDLIVLKAPTAERMQLETTPRAETVTSYVFTRASERAWETINRRLAEPVGGLFWIGGPPGCGKTHFLNYVIALSSRAGSVAPPARRSITCGVEVAGRVGAPEIEAAVLEALVEPIGGQRQASMIWREMRGAAALNVALEHARRLGIGALTVAIDFSAAEIGAGAAAYFAALAEVAAQFRNLKFTVLAAGRGRPPDAAVALEVAPAGADEEATVAVRRAWRLADGVEALVDDFYRGIDTGGLDAEAIYPFHPLTVRTLQVIASPPGTIPSISRLAREALDSALEDRDLPIARLIYPADLMENPAIARRVEARLGEAERAALRIALGALGHFHGNEKQFARQIISTLVLDWVCGRAAPAGIAELQARMPMLLGGDLDQAWTAPLMTELLRKLAIHTGGVIQFEADAPRFDPTAAGAPEVAVFNAALPLAKRFDPSLGAVHDMDEFRSRLERLGDAMGNAVEAANRTREVLKSALAQAHLGFPPDHEKAIADFIALAERGPHLLLEAAREPDHRDAAAAVISAYEALASAAAAVPRMRQMSEYLDASGLCGAFEDDPLRDPRFTAIATECQLLAAELGPRVLAGAARSFDALEARFQKFKWTCVELYRTAHAEWRREMGRLALLAADARRRFEALRRLNAIAALGPPEGEDLAARLAEASGRIVRCDFEGPIQPEVSPRCPHCGYLLCSPAPGPALAGVMEAIDRALSVKLAALSQSAIARIIRQHDRAHRLEGFLKITQAAQTDALVRVLDEKLARYLAQLLDENLAMSPIQPPHGLPAPDLKPPLLATGRLKSAPRSAGPSPRKAPPHPGRS